MGGHSQVVLPTGDVAAMAGPDEQVLSIEVDMNVVTEYRTSFPVLQDRRLPLKPTNAKSASAPSTSARPTPTGPT
jgi:predicted amidohydrolase